MAPFYFYGTVAVGPRLLYGIISGFVVGMADLYFVMRHLLQIEGVIDMKKESWECIILLFLLIFSCYNKHDRYLVQVTQYVKFLKGPSINDVPIEGEGRGSRNSDISNKGQYTKFGHGGGRGSKNRPKIRTSFMDGPLVKIIQVQNTY